MNGFFDCSLMNARGLGDEDFNQAVAAGEIDNLLRDLDPVQKARGSNRIFDNMAGYLLHRLFSYGNCAWPYYHEESGNSGGALAFICLTQHDGDTTSYTEDSTATSNDTAYIHKVTNSANTSSGGKRFEEDQITGWTTWTDNDDREAIYFRNRWLYTPTQGTSNNIRSIDVWFSTDADSTGTYSLDYGRIGRIRLKDAAGIPIIMNKTSSQVLVVEYTFGLVSM